MKLSIFSAFLSHSNTHTSVLYVLKRKYSFELMPKEETQCSRVFIDRKVHYEDILFSCFKYCNSDGRQGEVSKKFNLIFFTFHENFLVSRWIFQPTLIAILVPWTVDKLFIMELMPELICICDQLLSSSYIYRIFNFQWTETHKQGVVISFSVSLYKQIHISFDE